MQILIAQPHGFCGNQQYGVKAAISKAIKAAQKYPEVKLLKPLVHNHKVITWLHKKCNLKTISSLSQVNNNEVVILRSHGEIPQTYQIAKQKNLNIIDATCPLVKKTHQQIKQFAQQGKNIIYISSQPNHDEAIAAAAQAPQAVIVTTLDEILNLNISKPERTIVLTQTTLSILDTQKVLGQLKKKYPTLTICKHICPATTKRQQAVLKLCKKCDLIIVVGSNTSSNSNRLQEIALSQNIPAYLVNDVNQLQKKWFQNATKVGITSGASTPEWLLNQIIKKIKSFTL